MFSRKKSGSRKGAPIDLAAILAGDGDCLNLQSSSLKDADLNSIADHLVGNPDTESFKRIKILNLRQNKLTNESASALLKIIQTLPSLAVLDLSNNKFKGNAIPKVIRSALADKTRLTRIVYIGNKPGPEGLDHLANTFKDTPDLATVEFGWKTLEKNPPQLGPSSSSSSSSSSDTSLDTTTEDNHDQAKLAKRYPGGIPAQSIIGRCKNAIVSPDRIFISKFRGGGKFDTNVQWIPPPSADDETSFSVTIRFHKTGKQDMFLGWAPETIDPTGKEEFKKIGVYISCSAKIVSSLGSPVIYPALENPPKTGIQLLRTTYCPGKNKILFEVSHEGDNWDPLCIINETPSEPKLFPTAVLSRIGDRIELVGSVCELLPCARDKHSFKSLWVHGD